MNRIKGKRCLTMKQQILYNVLIAVAVTVLILSVVNRVFLHHTSMDTALNNYNEISRLTGKYLDAAIQNAESGINRMVFSDNFQEVLLDYAVKQGQAEQELPRYAVLDELTSSIVVSDLYSGIVSNVIVFDVEGKYIASMRDYNRDADISQSDWMEEVLKRNGKSLWLDTHRDANDTNLQYTNVLSVVKMVRSTNRTSDNKLYGQCIGYVLVNIKEQEFAKLYQDMVYGETGTMRLVNSENIILSSPDKEEIGQQLDSRLLVSTKTASLKEIDGKQLILSASYNRNTGWYLVSNVQMNELTVAAKNQGMNFAIIAVGVFLLILILMNYVSRRITKPLAKLQAEMKRVEQGEFKVKLSTDSSIVEIHDFINGFQMMVRKLEELMEHVYESGKREQEMQLFVTEARLAILQNQMNPHFLYNTLDSIGWMAALSGQNGISQMVNSLGDILRASVKMDTFISTVDTELNLLKKYLYIQKVRHGEKLKVTIEALDDVKECQILKFMLQPFVENAIVHGLRETGEQLSIHIRVYRQQELLISEIEDDGRGMEEQVRKQLFQEKEGNGKHTGTGCSNVYKRLQLVYPKQFQCQVESRHMKGSRICIQIPLIEGETRSFRNSQPKNKE